ncbi:hypothetical protein OAD02_06320, partial [Alphaproteobacteria bacterium]|nr:hypothetical protein [Alphaproteobacteria bacterium]
IPQGCCAQTDCEHAYWTLACRFIHKKITWENFRKKFIENGGSGIYSSWKLIYEEDVFINGNWKKRDPELYADYITATCPVSELIQPQLMQFPLNDESVDAADANLNALEKTIKYFS